MTKEVVAFAIITRETPVSWSERLAVRLLR